MEPVYRGMPPVDCVFTIKKDQGGKWGEIRCGGPCKDDYARIVIYHQIPGQRYVKLQQAAMASFRAAEDAIGGKIRLTGSWRSCASQAELYLSDRNRYAPPQTTAHCRGLAIDIDMNQSGAWRSKALKALLLREWYQARPDDEPWHASFGLEV